MNNHHNDIEANKEFGGLDIPKTATPFQVPESYFSNLATEITQGVLAAHSTDTTLDFSKENAFSVPDGYFDQFAERVTNQAIAADRIINGDIPWANNSRELPFEAPQPQYFENFVAELEKRLFRSEEEIEELSPLLSELKKTQPLAMPSGYFENNQLGKVKPEAKPAAKVIEHPAVKSMRWSTWAAAAAVLIIFSIGGWQFLGDAAVSKPSIEQRLAQVSNTQIQNYIDNHIEEFDINMLENSVSQSAKSNIGANVLSNISDEEIEAYLDGDI